MKSYIWEGPGALTSGGAVVKQGGEIPLDFVEKLGADREDKKTSLLEDFIKLKSITLVASEEAVVEEEVVKTLSELTDEEITALSLDELSSKRFTKPELQEKAEAIGHETVAGDGKKDFALSIFEHFNKGNLEPIS